MKQLTQKPWLMILLFSLALLAGPALAAVQTGEVRPDTGRQVLQKLQTAHVLYSQRDYTAARRLYLEVLPHYPGDFVILKNLAFCNYRLRRYEEAARHFQQAYDVNATQEILDYLARSLSSLQRYDEAARLFRQLAESPDGPADAWKFVAEAYAGAGKLAEAEAAYDAYLQRDPGDLGARTDLGELYVEKKEYGKAVEQFRLVLSANPNYTSALKGMALAAARQDNHVEALEYYDRVLRLDRRDGEALTAKAFVLFWMGRLQESKDLFTQLQQRYPRNREVAQALQRIQRRLDEQALAEAERTGDVAEVERQYRARLERDANDAEALKFMAEVTSNAEECRQSIDYGERALGFRPDDPELELTLAQSYALCERYDESYKHYQSYRQAQQKAAEKPLAELGWTMLHAGRQEEATNIFENVLTLNPDNTRANLGLARLFAVQKRYNEALARYDAVLDKSPDHYDALQGKALVLYWTGEYQRARVLLEQLAERKPDDSATQEVLASLDRREEAARWESMRPDPGAAPEHFVAYYEKRLEAYPDDASAMRGLAYQQGRLRNYGESIRWYRKSLGVEPDSRSTRIDLARTLAFDRQYDESIRLYSELLSETPEDRGLLESLARIYTWTDQDKEALDLYQRLLVLQPRDAEYWLAVVRLKMNMGDYQGARKSIETLLEIDPANREARLYLAQMSLDENQRAEALSYYDAVLARNPDDPGALYGKAKILYYDDKVDEAYEVASRLVELRPESFDGLYLLASIENRRRKRSQALVLLARADQVSPDNSEVRALTQRIEDTPTLTVRTSASRGREFDSIQDLRTQSYGAVFGWEIGRTDHFLRVGYSHAASPTPGIRGAVGPSEFLYWQRIRASREWELRGGIGAVHFTDGEDDAFPGEQAREFQAMGMAGVSYSPIREFRLDVDVRRSAIDYTPRAARFGVMRNRVSMGLNFFIDPRTRASVDYGYEFFNALTTGGGLQAHTGDIRFMRNLYRDDRIAFDMGYEAEFLDFSDTDAFLGFFSPDFYQVHQAVAEFHANLAPRLDFDLAGGFGVRQRPSTDALGREVKPIRRGGSLKPSFTIRVNKHLAVTLRYTFYTTAQLLESFAAPGTRDELQGNIFSVTTDWSF